MFDDKNHAHAMATAFGSLGGFAAAPAGGQKHPKTLWFNSLLLPFSSGKVEVLLTGATHSPPLSYSQSL